MANDRPEDYVPLGCECPLCGEDRGDRLEWSDNFETVCCTMCGEEYKLEPDFECDGSAPEDR